MTTLTRDDLARLDPRDLIGEAYRMEGLTPQDCRVIFFDWAMAWDVPENGAAAVTRLLDHYGPDRMEHPMTAVLQESRQTAAAPRRRGGRKGRV